MKKIKEGKHLKAYLRGYERFHHGYEIQINPITGLKENVAKYYNVQEELIAL